MVEEIIDTSEPSIAKGFLDHLSIQNDPSSLLSLLSSITAKQAKLLNFIFTSELMTLENAIRGDQESPIMDVYNTLWLFANLNMFFKEKYADKMGQYTSNNAKAAVGGMKWSKIASQSTMEYRVQQQLIALINENGMKYVTKLGDDIKVKLTEALKQSIVNNESANDAINRMSKIIKAEAYRARTIVRTETMRAANSGAYAQALNDGQKYYVVDSRAEACIYCKKNYDGKVFKIDDKSGMPPLHPNCTCIPVFFDKRTDAKMWSDKLSDDIAKQVAALEKKGLTVNPDGTGAEVNKINPKKRLKN